MATNINIGNRLDLVGGGATFRMGEHGPNLEVGMVVNDQAIRRLGIDHNGFEHPFVLVPDHGGWKRYNLQYHTTLPVPGSSDRRDLFNRFIDLQGENLDIHEINRAGVAFGLDVQGRHSQTKATLWLQGPNDNLRPAGGS